MLKRLAVAAYLLLLAFPLRAHGQEKLDIPFVPSPMIIVQRMLQLAEIKAGRSRLRYRQRRRPRCYRSGEKIRQPRRRYRFEPRTG